MARAAAFFDMDRTVLRVDTGILWMRFLRRRGEISRLTMLRAVGWALRYKLAVIDLHELSRRLVAPLAGTSEAELLAKAALFYVEHVAPHVAARARDRIAAHRSRGDRVALLTASTRYVAEPLAAALGLDGTICSRLEVEDGRFTGRVDPPLCFGAGKIARAERWAEAEGIDLSASTFYTDSYNDLPMLERVGRPVAVNPDGRLARLARRRGWPIEIWDVPVEA